MKNLLFLLCCSLWLQAMAQPQVGVQLYSFRQQFKADIPSTVQQIRSMGIQVVEGGDSYGMDPTAFRDLLNKNNISVVSIGADFNELKSALASVIGKARLYGATYVVCFWIPHEGDQLSVAEAETAATVFNHAGARLKEEGLTLCYHPHGFEFAQFGQGTVFDHFLQKTEAANVFIEMDVFWIKQASLSPVTFLQQYSSRIKLLHLKDRKPGSPDSNNGHADVETNVPLGKGDVGIAAIMQAVQQLKILYVFIEDESSRSMQQVPKSLSFLQALK